MNPHPIRMKTVGIYVVNFMDDERRQRITNRFKGLGLDCHFIHPVTTEDPRIKQDMIPFYKRSWAILFQHVDSVRQFYEQTTFDYCIVCEDDIYISRNLKEELPKAIELFESANLDILLLSYLWPYTVHESNHHFPLKAEGNGFKLHGYPNDLWGAHMYMVSREHAKRMIDRFTKEYAETQEMPTPFCSDWQITKFGERALLVPMVGVEEGGTKTDHEGQNQFHESCFRFNYTAERFL